MTDQELKGIEERAKEMLTEKAHQMSAYKARECIQDIPRLIKAIRERDKRIAELEEAIESASEAVYYGYRNRAFEVLELVLRGIRRDIGLRNWEVKQDG